jgi:hypothetical protein
MRERVQLLPVVVANRFSSAAAALPIAAQPEGDGGVGVKKQGTVFRSMKIMCTHDFICLSVRVRKLSVSLPARLPASNLSGWRGNLRVGRMNTCAISSCIHCLCLHPKRHRVICGSWHMLAYLLSTNCKMVRECLRRPAHECTRTHTCIMGLTYGFFNFSAEIGGWNR